MKILYIEDNKTDAELTRRQLNKDISGNKLTVVTSLTEARKHLFPKCDFDMVLLDMNLPDGSGLDLLMEIKGENRPVAVIVLTGSGDEESAVAALKAGADDYIVKQKSYLDNLAKIIIAAITHCNENFSRNQKKLNVVYTEPNTADIELTKRHLSQYAPYLNLTVCNNSDEVLDIIKIDKNNNCNFDVLLTDYRLAGMSGLELIKTIRQIRQIPIAIVMVSGQGDEEVAIQALRLGADEYLVKRTNYLYRLPSMLLSAFQHHELEKKQVALQQSEERFRRLAENSLDIIYRYDYLPQKKYSYVSPAANSITGYTPEEFYADPDLGFKMIYPEDHLLLENLTEYFNKPLTLRWINKNGSLYWTEQRNVPIYDENENLIAYEGVARDITEQILAAEKLAMERILLRTLIDNLPDNIYVKDTKMRKVLVNKADLEVIGKPEEEVLGKDDSQLFSKEIAEPFLSDDRKVIEEGKPILNKEELVKRIDGRSRWLLTSKLPLYDHEGKITGLIGIGHDITERKKVEEILLERDQRLKEKNEEFQRLNQEYLMLNEELTESIEQMQKMNEELRTAKEKAEESDRLKTSFLANMSHEIRTPMNGILGFTQILQQTPLNDSKQEQYLNVINTSCERLLTVVNDIIDISKIESGIIELQYDTVHLNELLNELYYFFEQSCKKKNLTLEIVKNEFLENAIISTDGTKLLQVLSNLADNAIKFTKSGSITISEVLKDSMIEFAVKDTGVGIDEKNINIIFDRFRQADENYTREFGGTGLGLAIAKAYVNKLGGSIWVESIKGEGSTFHFTIPYDTGAQKISTMEKERIDPHNYNWAANRILIAEDEESNYEYLVEALEPTKITIYHGTDGEETLEMYTKYHPNLILMDIKMPKLDGYAVTRKIRENDTAIPIIALSAYSLKIEDEKIQKAGFNNYISKPVSIDTLILVLKDYL